MNTPRLRIAAVRLRLLAILAGLAWLTGLHPGVPVRLLVVAVVIDALAARPRPTTPRDLAKGGDLR